MTTMTEDDKCNLLYRINDEGFDYTFDGYSDWEEVKDEKFHLIRHLYLAAKEDLLTYIKE